MKRPLKPVTVLRPAYPVLDLARRILRGAALAGGVLASSGAFADITPPVGPGRGDSTAPRLKGQLVRPNPPPLPGGMGRPNPVELKLQPSPQAHARRDREKP